MRSCLLNKDTVYLCGDGDPDAHAVGRGHTVMFGRPMQNGTVAYTRDGGKTWTVVEVATNFELTAIIPKKDANFLVGTFGGEMHRDGDFGIFHAGGSWSDGTNVFKGGSLKTQRVYRALSGMCRIDDTHFAAVGSPVSVGFMPTAQGGSVQGPRCPAPFSVPTVGPLEACQRQRRKDTLRALAYRKGQPLVAVGDNGEIILLSHDKGVTWSKDQLTRQGFADGRGVVQRRCADRIGGRRERRYRGQFRPRQDLARRPQSMIP